MQPPAGEANPWLFSSRWGWFADSVNSNYRSHNSKYTIFHIWLKSWIVCQHPPSKLEDVKASMSTSDIKKIMWKHPSSMSTFLYQKDNVAFWSTFGDTSEFCLYSTFIKNINPNSCLLSSLPISFETDAPKGVFPSGIKPGTRPTPYHPYQATPVTLLGQ